MVLDVNFGTYYICYVFTVYLWSIFATNLQMLYMLLLCDVDDIWHF